MPPRLLDQQPDHHGQADPAPSDAPAADPTLVPQPQPPAPDEATPERDLAPTEAFTWAGLALDPATALGITTYRYDGPTPGRWLPLEPAASAPDDANLSPSPATPATAPPAPQQSD